MRDDKERLKDILEAIELIQGSLAGNRPLYLFSPIELSGLVRYLQIIGEACRCLSDALKTQYPEVPWSNIIGMRHLLVHEYFDVDLEIVQKVIQDHLPFLKAKIQAMLASWDC